MYSNVLLAHRIIVTIFLVHYVIKWLMLVSNSSALAGYTKATRIIEMLVSLAFLITGGWMLVQPGAVTTLMVVKLVCVFASIPIAIIGFKRSNKALATLAILLILAAYGLAEVNKKHKEGGNVVNTSTVTDPVLAGKNIYEGSCINCHGADGKLGGSGAKDLTVTTLSNEEMKAVIIDGKGAMPPYKGKLSDDQVKDVLMYVTTLKQ
jgi:mono/diheme cytochrome c family protein